MVCAECGVVDMPMGVLPVGPNKDKPVCVMCAKDIMGTPAPHAMLEFELVLMTRNMSRFGQPPDEFKHWIWAVSPGSRPYWSDG